MFDSGFRLHCTGSTDWSGQIHPTRRLRNNHSRLTAQIEIDLKRPFEARFNHAWILEETDMNEFSPSALPQITIATPCCVEWESMRGDDQVRFCQRCLRNVYRAGTMDEQQMLRLIARREKICDRLYVREDGTLVTGPCPSPTPTPPVNNRQSFDGTLD